MKWLFLPCLCCLLFLESCQTLYNPNMVQAPLFSEGGEFQGAMQVGSNGYNLQMAWSPAYHVALMASGNTFSIIQDSVGADNYRQSFGEVGIGAYSRLSNYWRLEFMGGYGRGSVGDADFSSQYGRLFLQAATGVSSPFFDFGFVQRFSFVNHYQDKVLGSVATMERQGVFVEPHIVMRAGVEQLKFSLQGGLTFLAGAGDLKDDFQKGLVGTFGIHLTFGKDFSRYGETRFRLPATAP